LGSSYLIKNKIGSSRKKSPNTLAIEKLIKENSEELAEQLSQEVAKHLQKSLKNKFG